MKRSILTLIVLSAIVTLAAESALAGGRDRDGRGDRDRQKREGVSVEASRGGVVVSYDRHETRGGHRAPARRSSHHANVRTRTARVALRLGKVIFPRRQRWIPGHFVIEERRVRTPDRVEKFWVPDRYEMRRDACGHRYRVLVESGHHERRVIPGRVVVKHERVWVPGHWDRF